jgi:hypothetical protein
MRSMGAFGQKTLGSYPRPRHDPSALNGELIDPRLADVEAMARWLDYAFTLPGGFHFGFAGFIGLIPGIGDLLDGLLSLYIVWRAIQIGVPRVTITRMLVNVGIEASAGAVPFLGALFDSVFKANRRNYQLLTSHLREPDRQRSRDWWFLIVTLALVCAGIAIPIWILMELVKHI